MKTPAFEPEADSSDELIVRLRERSYLDFRNLRIKNKDDQEYRKEIISAAERVAGLLSPDDGGGSVKRLSLVSRIRSGGKSSSLAKRADGDVGEPEVAPIVTNRTIDTNENIIVRGKKDIESGIHYHSIKKTLIRLFLSTIAVALILSVIYWRDSIFDYARNSIFGENPPIENPPIEIIPEPRDCVVQRSTQSYREPNTQAMLGPHLSPGERARTVGRVAGSDWLVGAEENGVRFYFRAVDCGS
ncbi:hypothetical protein [Inquilinus sp. CA228]|uniref:hypothetical protein n=1 Tax=Inquilinus sp. CA228 TaxID=3455609 RepID=UPI003F8D2892